MRFNNEYTIIRDPEILGEDYVPPNIPGRDPQLKELTLCLRPALKKKKPINAWLYGKPGTGKTALARYVLRQLESDTAVCGTYINCWEYNTLYAVIDKIIRDLRILLAEKLSTAFKLERFEKHLRNEPFVIVLDEIDQPPPKERNAIIYNLCSIGSVGLICICNSRYFLFSLDERIKSRMNAQQIEFQPYSLKDLVFILEQRAEFGLVPDTWTKKILEQIADLSEGDARVAIQTLKNAAQFAEADNSKAIKEEHVKKGWNSAKGLRKTYLLDKLTEHHKILYSIIEKQKEIASGELWESYLNECRAAKKRPIALRTYNAYINKLCETGLIKPERAAIRGNVRVFRIAK